MKNSQCFLMQNFRCLNLNIMVSKFLNVGFNLNALDSIKICLHMYLYLENNCIDIKDFELYLKKCILFYCVVLTWYIKNLSTLSLIKKQFLMVFFFLLLWLDNLDCLSLWTLDTHHQICLKFWHAVCLTIN